jgi:lipopolysaccharide transport system permease protein
MKDGAMARPTPLGANRNAALDVITIEPSRGWPSLDLAELWRLRRICLVLARRSLLVRYRQTVIGAGWSLLQPLLLMAIFTIFFGLLGRGSAEGLPFPVFYLLGLVPYQMISKILNEGSTSITSNGPLVTRVYFPRVYFPTSVGLAVLVDLALSLVAVAALLLVYRIVPGLSIIVAPFLVAIGWIFAIGVSYWLSALNVVYRDVAQLIPFLTQLLMFVSPIIYTSSIIPEPYRFFYFLNPVALVVEGFRWAFANAPGPPAYAWVLGPFVAIVVLTTGYVFFKKREPGFADYV